MKIAAVLLVALGLIAAVCAAVLVKALTLPQVPAAARDPDVDILVAARELPAMTVVDASMVQLHKVPKSQVPADAVLNSVHVVGKVLSTKLLPGQAFSKNAFARDGSAIHLAAALPAGKRAVSVGFSDTSGMAAIIYPGSVVDVIVSIEPPASEGRATERVSATLLQAVQVLAVGDQTIVAEAEKDAKTPSAGTSSRRRVVTLLVDPEQAELIQLAQAEGVISLTLRNPLDDQQVAKRVTRMSELPELNNARSKVDPLQTLGIAPVTVAAAPPTPTLFDETPAAPASDAAPAEAPPSLWEMIVTRGSASETQTFPMPQASELSDQPVVGAGSPNHGS